MNRMKKILLAVLVMLSSCSDSFLDLSDPSTLSPQYFPKTMADLESLTTSCYAGVIPMGLYGQRLMASGALVLDHTVDMAWTGDDAWNQEATNNLKPDNEYVQYFWAGYYQEIGYANTLLEEIDRIDKSKFTQTDLARIEQMKGEAYFWRGWAHQQLVQFFGEGYPCNGDGDKQGVPIRLVVPTSLNSMIAPRNTVNEVYQAILDDYAFAESLLPERWTERADFPRPTKVAARSYKGQVYLFQGQNELAKTELKKVIDSSGKTLLPFDDYSKMFNENQIEYSNESILEINFKDGSSTGWGTGEGGEGSMYALVAALCYDNNGTSEAAGWGNIFFHDSNIQRFGNDPRLHLAALEPGTPVIMYGQPYVVSRYKDIEPNMQGWSLRKYNPLTYNTYEVSISVGINMYLMRLADVYLMYAEACQLSGDDPNAREYVNKVKRRAYSKPINSPSDVDITASGTQLRDDIREERFKELCGEGIQHWLDVCRWKTLDKEIQTWYPTTRVGRPHYDPQDLYLPIPISELENNPNMTQSEGYK
jgi:tetratricopeptide (TPR) repeat protein